MESSTSDQDDIVEQILACAPKRLVLKDKKNESVILEWSLISIENKTDQPCPMHTLLRQEVYENMCSMVSPVFVASFNAARFLDEPVIEQDFYKWFNEKICPPRLKIPLVFEIVKDQTGTILGFALLAVSKEIVRIESERCGVYLSTEEIANAVWAIFVAVDPSAQGRGLCPRLLNAVTSNLLDTKTIFLLVDEKNVQARAVYKKMGFMEHAFEIREDEYGSVVIPCFLNKNETTKLL